jgi:hypothetical protein
MTAREIGDIMKSHRSIALAGLATATVAAAVLIGAAAGHAGRSRAGTPAKDRTHFAGLPSAGTKASTPTTGRLVVGLSSTAATATTVWDVYADGRIVWQKWTRSGDATVVPAGARRLDTGYVQQRLSFGGVQLLLSKILATGLFEHNLKLEVGRGHPWVFHQVRKGDRMATIVGVPATDPSWREHFTKATPAQTRALARIEALLADPASWLPTTVWADRRIRVFVPSHYQLAVDRSYPDLSKLPPPAGRVLARYRRLRRHACQVITTDQARALLQAFAKAGISPSDNHAWNIGFDFRGLGLPHPSYLHLHPALPDDVSRNGRC